jgi:FtsH-binding integral membrane protein
MLGRRQLRNNMKKTYNYIGIGFWAGAGIYSLINMAMNLNNVSQSKILNYNYIITGVAVIGLIFNIILFKIKNKTK